MKVVCIEPLGISDEKCVEMTNVLAGVGCEFVYYKERASNDDEIIQRIGDASVVMLANQPLSVDVINACRNIKLISVAFTGVDHLPMSKCKENGILVCNAAGYSTASVAELTIGLIISLLRDIVKGDKMTRELKGRGTMLGFDLCGKTVGVIGTGAIGLHVVQLLKAFGCRVLTYSRTAKQIDGVENVSLPALLEQSDIVTLHVPLTDSTKGMIGAKELKMMKRGAMIVNTARGGVVDHVALAEMLTNGHLAGAALDVYEYEPPLQASHSILSAPNTILLPHVAYATAEAMERRADIVVANILKWIQGEAQNVQ